MTGVGIYVGVITLETFLLREKQEPVNLYCSSFILCVS